MEHEGKLYGFPSHILALFCAFASNLAKVRLGMRAGGLWPHLWRSTALTPVSVRNLNCSAASVDWCRSLIWRFEYGGGSSRKVEGILRASLRL